MRGHDLCDKRLRRIVNFNEHRFCVADRCSATRWSLTGERHSSDRTAPRARS
jgi:hypothetical protein